MNPRHVVMSRPDGQTDGLLIVHPGALGDVLLALPCFRTMRERLHCHQVALLASAGVADLLKEAGEVGEALSLDGEFGCALFSSEPTLISQRCDWFERCDHVIGFFSDPEGTLSATLGRFLRADVMLRSPFDRELRAIHQSARFVEIVEGVAPMQVSLNPPLQISLGRRTKARETLLRMGVDVSVEELVAVHPGSGSPYKCADPRLFAGVINWARDRGAQVVMIAGPADGAAVSAVTELLLPDQVPILDGCDLTILASVLAETSLFVGNDSGVTHLAASVGAPTVALFGPTDPARWRPIGPHVRVLQGDSCDCRSDWSRVRDCGRRPCLRIDLPTLLSVCHRIAGT